MKHRHYLWAAIVCFSLAGFVAFAWAQTSDEILRNVYDDAAEALKTTGVAGGTASTVAIDQTGTANDVDTELPAAAALADSTTNPTVPSVASFSLLFGASLWHRARNVGGAGNDNANGNHLGAIGLYGFDGAAYDIIRGESANGLDVDPTRAAPAATVDTEFAAQAADFTIEAATTSLRLMGYSIRESAVVGAAATVVLRHDADGTCNGNAVAYVELAADQSIQMDYNPRGLAVASGLCADVLAGTVDLVAHLRTE